MSYSSSFHKPCGICSMNASTGLEYTAECSHTFHFKCIQSFARNQLEVCPVCQAKWNNPPFVGHFPPPSSPFNASSSNALNPLAASPFPPPSCPFNASSTNAPNPFGASLVSFGSPFNLDNPFNTTNTFYNPYNGSRIAYPYYIPPFPPVNRFTLIPKFEPEPFHFSDDDPVFAINTEVKETSSVLLSIKSIPERSAISASESISQFPVLVGLKAPLVSSESILNRAPVDLVAVLDVSGSMFGSKLDLVKRAMLFVIDNLSYTDRLSIVSFSNLAKRISHLTRMTERGRESAKEAVNLLCADGGTNIVEGLKKGVRVLEERREMYPVSSIIFLSDGDDTCHSGLFRSSYSEKGPNYLHLLPPSICPRNRTAATYSEPQQQQTFPVHAFGFGSDHDAMAMHAISDSSNGTFSYIESVEMVQNAFANCIGGLLSVVIQDLKLTAWAASHGVEIKSIPSGRYASEISNHESQGVIDVGDMYAEEERQFLFYLSIPKLIKATEAQKMSLLDITCSYKDVISKEIIQMDADLVEISRPNSLSGQDRKVNIEVDRQRNRVLVAESMAEAQKKAESGDMAGAQAVLANTRAEVLKSVSGEVGDSLCRWLEAEMKDLQERMSSRSMYEQSGRAFAYAGMSSHATQRATTRGHMVPGAFLGNCVSSFGASAAPPIFGPPKASAGPTLAFGASASSAFGASAPPPGGSSFGSVFFGASADDSARGGFGGSVMSSAGPSQAFGSAGTPDVFGGYATRFMADMVGKSNAQQHNNSGQGSDNAGKKA